MTQDWKWGFGDERFFGLTQAFKGLPNQRSIEWARANRETLNEEGDNLRETVLAAITAAGLKEGRAHDIVLGSPAVGLAPAIINAFASKDVAERIVAASNGALWFSTIELHAAPQAPKRKPGTPRP